MTAWISGEQPAGDGGQQHPRLPGPELVRPEDPEEAAHQQHALEPDVHHPAALGEHAADRREDERRRVPEHRGGQGRPHEHRLEVRHARDRGRDAQRPERERQHHRRDPEAAAAPPRRPRPQGERRRRDRDRHGRAPRRHRRHGDPDRDDRRGRSRRCRSPERRAGRGPAPSRGPGRAPRGRAGRAWCSATTRRSAARARRGTRCRGRRQARARQAPAPPDGEDQDVGSDEQQHEALDLRVRFPARLGSKTSGSRLRVEVP